MAKTKLESMGDFFTTMDRETLTKADFEEKMQRVLALIQRLIKNIAENTARAESKADTALKQIADKHNLSITDFRKETNRISVESKSSVSRSDDKFFENEGRLDKLRGLVDVLNFDSAEAAKEKAPSRTELATLVAPLEALLNNHEGLVESFDTLLDDFKNLEKKFEKIPLGSRTRVLAGPNVNAVNIHIGSNQCDGENRRFTMPTARKIIKFEMSQHPFNLYEDTATEVHGFTVGRGSILLNSAVPAPRKNQSAAIHYVK